MPDTGDLLSELTHDYRSYNRLIKESSSAQSAADVLRIQFSRRVQDLERVHRQEETRIAKCLLLPFGMREVVVALRVTEQFALRCPALTVDELRLEQVQSLLAAWVSYMSGSRQNVQPGHEVVEPRIRIREFCVHGSQR